MQGDSPLVLLTVLGQELVELWWHACDGVILYFYRVQGHCLSHNGRKAQNKRPCNDSKHAGHCSDRFLKFFRPEICVQVIGLEHTAATRATELRCKVQKKSISVYNHKSLEIARLLPRNEKRLAAAAHHPVFAPKQCAWKLPNVDFAGAHQARALENEAVKIDS